MKIVNPSFEYVYEPNVEQIMNTIEKAYRICYLSESNGNRDEFIKTKIKAGHESPLEHEKITVVVTTNRGITHEIVRHRIGSYCQESTRYCNYSKDKFGNEITFIRPEWASEDVFEFNSLSDNEFWVKHAEKYGICSAGHSKISESVWLDNCKMCEDYYLISIKNGYSPQQARNVLNNSVATKIMITFNIREWRHFFKLRALGNTGSPHPEMTQIAIPMLKDFAKKMPVLFGDLAEQIKE